MCVQVYLVGTPIGNLGDISLRALQTLESCDVILAEDTRRATQLLSAYGIARRGKEVLSYHAHNAAARAPAVLERLAAGARVALVSDAGMPAVSDPGAELVAAMCDAQAGGRGVINGSGGEGAVAAIAVPAAVPVVPVPGASAVLAALAASGFSAERSAFEFAGFLPAKRGERREALKVFASRSHPVVAFAPPHKLAAMLEDAAAELGEARRVVVARELTKRFEELWRGTLAEACEAFGDGARGEVTLVFDSAPAGTGEADGGGTVDDHALELLVRVALDGGEKVSALSRRIAKEAGVTRSRVYDLALTLQAEREEQA